MPKGSGDERKPKRRSKGRAIAKRCAGRNKRGGPCGRAVTAEALFCPQHSDQAEVHRPVKLTNAKPFSRPEDDPDWPERLLEAVRSGRSVDEACGDVGVSRQALYKRIEAWPDFAEQWRAARAALREMRADLAEDRLFESLMAGSVQTTVTKVMGVDTKTVVRKKTNEGGLMHLLRAIRPTLTDVPGQAPVTVVLADDDGKDEDDG